MFELDDAPAPDEDLLLAWEDDSSFLGGHTQESLAVDVHVVNAESNARKLGQDRHILPSVPILRDWSPQTEKSPFRQTDNQATYTPIQTKRSQKRKFPGPAGVLPCKTPNSLSFSENASPTVSSPGPDSLCADVQELVPISQGPSEPLSTSSQWKTLTEDLGPGAAAILAKFSIKAMLLKARHKLLPKGKVPLMAGIIDHLDIHGSDASVVLRDTTGKMNGSLHRDLIKDPSKAVQVGSLMVLRQVSVISPSARNHYLNITPGNVVLTYSAKDHNTGIQRQTFSACTSTSSHAPETLGYARNSSAVTGMLGKIVSDSEKELLSCLRPNHEQSLFGRNPDQFSPQVNNSPLLHQTSPRSPHMPGSRFGGPLHNGGALFGTSFKSCGPHGYSTSPRLPPPGLPKTNRLFSPQTSNLSSGASVSSVSNPWIGGKNSDHRTCPDSKAGGSSFEMKKHHTNQLLNPPSSTIIRSPEDSFLDDENDDREFLEMCESLPDPERLEGNPRQATTDSTFRNFLSNQDRLSSLSSAESKKYLFKRPASSPITTQRHPKRTSGSEDKLSCSRLDIPVCKKSSKSLSNEDFDENSLFPPNIGQEYTQLSAKATDLPDSLPVLSAVTVSISTPSLVAANQSLDTVNTSDNKLDTVTLYSHKELGLARQTHHSPKNKLSTQNASEKTSVNPSTDMSDKPGTVILTSTDCRDPRVQLGHGSTSIVAAPSINAAVWDDDLNDDLLLSQDF